MRTSVASLAVLSRVEAGRLLYLGHWNAGWGAYSLPGGHLRDGEAHRACLVRELAEPDELRLPPPPGDPDGAAAAPVAGVDVARVWVRVAAEPLGRLAYEAFSQSAGERTSYAVELFAAELSPDARQAVADNPDVRWLTEAEVEAGRAADGRAVSDTLRHHLGWLARLTPVSWALAAWQRTREVMAEVLAQEADEGRLADECAFVARQLRLLFPEARSLVIRQRFEGFRPRVRPHKLLVEVARADATLAPGAFACREVHVVKVGRPTEADRAGDLEDELAGWRRCEPGGTDTILSTLRGVHDATGRCLGLIYGDAVTALGGRTSDLEDAVRECCRFGLPTVDSVVRCLHELYDRLDLRLYGQSFEAAPELHLAPATAPGHRVRRDRHEPTPDQPWPTQFRARIDRGLALLSETLAPPAGEERRRLRREALALLTVRDGLDFLDPFDYLQGALDGRHPVPRMLVGRGHGDLHGRNVQVGRLLDAVGAPAVFDYGDMHPANHIGWDFVKLETELKVRVYRHLCPRERRGFLRDVADFEARLARRTVAFHHDSPALEPPAETDARWERLSTVVLEVRRQARRCLGAQRHRLDHWLEEYYFLLACYGCAASHFPTYDHQEWLAVYCSAGTAARQLSLAWRNLVPDVEAARRHATEMLTTAPTSDAAGLAAAALAVECFARPRLNHHARQEFARVWVEADVGTAAHFLAAGLALLEGLQREFPHALEVTELRALALLELNREREALDLVQGVRRRHVESAYEIECRLGRLLRQFGERLWPADQPQVPPPARAEFRRSLAVYRRAWEASGHFYPGVVAAQLQLLMADNVADRAAAQELARQVLAVARAQPSTDLWALVAQADAHVLLGEHEAAEAVYRRARPNCSAQNLRSVTRQLRLVRRALDERGRGFWADARLNEVFPPAAVAATLTAPPVHGHRPAIQ